MMGGLRRALPAALLAVALLLPAGRPVAAQDSARQAMVQELEVAVAYLRTENYGAAIPILQRLADYGLLPARYNLGLAYYDGLGVERSLDEAYDLWMKAAVCGLPEAQAGLARLIALNWEKPLLSIPFRYKDYQAPDKAEAYGRVYAWLLRAEQTALRGMGGDDAAARRDYPKLALLLDRVRESQADAANWIDPEEAERLRQENRDWQPDNGGCLQ